MDITLYDKDGKSLEYEDLQDKLYWCELGETKEKAFVRRFGSDFAYEINPAKSKDRYALDLISSKSGKLTDLKSQHTPFFTAGSKYNIDPNYAVVFNVKDKVRYEAYYPNIDVLYYVNWVAIKALIYGRLYEVAPFEAIYQISFGELLTILSRSPIHTYRERVGDRLGNAKESYIFDIREPAFIRLY